MHSLLNTKTSRAPEVIAGASLVAARTPAPKGESCAAGFMQRRRDAEKGRKEESKN